MGYFRIRIVLLSLGVVLGYGSALAHIMHMRAHGGRGYWDCTAFEQERAAPPSPKLH
jgi:hypothetical protein